MATKVTFVMTHYQRDAALSLKTEAALKTMYPTAQVLNLEDTANLKNTPGGEWTQRWMKAAADWTSPDIIVKLDPDTQPLIAVTTWPTTEMFGQQSPADAYFKGSTNIICGACIGFKTEAVKKILASGLLTNAKYTVKPYICAERRYGFPRPTIALQDPIMADIALRLGLTTGEWPGLFMQMHWEPKKKVPAATTFDHPVRN